MEAPKFRPSQDTIFDHLAVINENMAKLSTLPSQELTDILHVAKVTPENIGEVLKTVHIPDPEELVTMYGDDKVKIEARGRTLARQGRNWEKNLTRVSPENMIQACDTINAILANLGHVRKEIVRIEIASVMDRFTPAPDYGPEPTDAQKIALANRPLNFAQELAWTAALAKPGTPYRAGVNEIVTITIDGSSYSYAPDSRVSQIPGIPENLR